MEPLASSRCGPNWCKSISIFLYLGHRDSFKDGLVTQAEPRRCEKTFIRVSEKENLIPMRVFERDFPFPLGS